jgi:predicted RND superfamily exporter protein
VRPFEEKDGTRGRIVYIVPTVGRSVYNAHYLMRWADSFREVRLPNGEVIRGTGDPVIFSDMLISVGEDAPRAIALSFAGTLVVLLVAFRRRASSWLALVTLMLGLSWLLGFLALKNIKLNFLNFVALPISIGIGADYALNVLKRYEIEGEGYLALLLSMNKAVQSFGLAAAAGEVTTLLSAVLVLPGYLFWKRARAEQAASK